MSRPINIEFSVPEVGYYRVKGTLSSGDRIDEYDYTVLAHDEREAFEKIFGCGTYGYYPKEEGVCEYHPDIEMLRNS